MTTEQHKQNISNLFTNFQYREMTADERVKDALEIAAMPPIIGDPLTELIEAHKVIARIVELDTDIIQLTVDIAALEARTQ